MALAGEAQTHNRKWTSTLSDHAPRCVFLGSMYRYHDKLPTTKSRPDLNWWTTRNMPQPPLTTPDSPGKLRRRCTAAAVHRDLSLRRTAEHDQLYFSVFTMTACTPQQIIGVGLSGVLRGSWKGKFDSHYNAGG